MAYKDFISTVKRKAAKGEFSKIKGVLPHVLKAWMENWKKPEVIARSEQASRNRSSGPEGPGSGPVIHHGGSRSTEKLGFDAALENDIDFEYTGIYTHMRLHRVNGVWTDPRSQRIYEAVQRRIQEERAPLPGSNEMREVTPAKVEEIYKEECKVGDKGRMIGKGCLSQMYAAHSRGSRSSSMPVQTQYEERIRELEAKLAAQKEEMEAKLKAQNDEMLARDQKRARQEEEREREYAEFGKNMKKMMAFMQSSPGFDSFQ